MHPFRISYFIISMWMNSIPIYFLYFKTIFSEYGSDKLFITLFNPSRGVSEKLSPIIKILLIFIFKPFNCFSNSFFKSITWLKSKIIYLFGTHHLKGMVVGLKLSQTISGVRPNTFELYLLYLLL